MREYRISDIESAVLQKRTHHRLFKANKPPHHEQELKNYSEFSIAKNHPQSRLTSFVTVEEKASANPARLAEMLGFMIATTAVTPTTPLESKLKRVDTQRFTGKAFFSEVKMVSDRK